MVGGTMATSRTADPSNSRHAALPFSTRPPQKWDWENGPIPSPVRKREKNQWNGTTSSPEREKRTDREKTRHRGDRPTRIKTRPDHTPRMLRHQPGISSIVSSRPEIFFDHTRRIGEESTAVHANPADRHFFGAFILKNGFPSGKNPRRWNFAVLRGLRGSTSRWFRRGREPHARRKGSCPPSRVPEVPRSIVLGLAVRRGIRGRKPDRAGSAGDHLGGDFFGQFRVVAQIVLGLLATLTQPDVAVVEPGA